MCINSVKLFLYSLFEAAHWKNLQRKVEAATWKGSGKQHKVTCSDNFGRIVQSFGMLQLGATIYAQKKNPSQYVFDLLLRMLEILMFS